MCEYGSAIHHDAKTKVHGVHGRQRSDMAWERGLGCSVRHRMLPG